MYRVIGGYKHIAVQNLLLMAVRMRIPLVGIFDDQNPNKRLFRICSNRNPERKENHLNRVYRDL